MTDRNSYFCTNEKIAVTDGDLARLWDQNKIAVHHPGKKSGSDPVSLDPKEYEIKWERFAMQDLNRLSNEGGYLWMESRTSSSAKVGKVIPGAPIEIVDAVRSGPPQLRLGDRPGAKLKTLQMVDVKEIPPNEAMALRTVRPRRDPICRWEKCGTRLADLVEGKDVERTWRNLRPEMRLAVCAEFLRHHEVPDYPRVKYFLLPVVDRDPGKKTSNHYYEVDIYGIADDGSEVLGQVPLRDDHMKYAWQMNRKVEALKRHSSSFGRKLIGFWDSGGAFAYHTPTLDEEHFEETGILHIPVTKVLKWVEEQPVYAGKLFST